MGSQDQTKGRIIPCPLEKQKFIVSRTPRVHGGMLLIPHGLIDTVAAAKRRPGNDTTDLSAQKVGYDIMSCGPDARHRFIGAKFTEVKGRANGAKSVMISHQEIITSLHEPKKFILAIVEVNDELAGKLRYVRGARDKHQPRFGLDAI